MEPETMEEIPVDLFTKWKYIAVCASDEGRRVLITANRGKTYSWSEDGNRLHSFSSMLPGGSHLSCLSREYSILDCWESGEGNYWILDIMCWRGHSFYDCDVEFRWVLVRSLILRL